ncbi:MAG: methylmalonyl-CoA carboxytransferase subunit 5S [Myxococcales bacterium]|jgi:methylmalonyl-CoA carboxyltransferase 5S subunit|nr:methylmalonyl-CoA carboxytransferase subunit 5S [Myxococcales bacterium]
MKKINVTDLILRDAHQSLMATRMTFADMAPACPDLDVAGYWSIECWGGATFDSCIRFLNEDPWERLRNFKKLMPKTPLQMLLRGQNLLGYRHYGDEIVDRFVMKAAENGVDVFRVFDALNDPRNLQRSIAAVKKAGKHAQGTISYTVSPVHTLDAFANLAQELEAMGCDSICIKDMAALIKPQAAYDLVKAIKAKVKIPVHLHSHATTGVTMVALMKAIEAGCDGVDTSISALSLGTGHNPTESLHEMLEGTGYETGLDIKPILRARDHFKQVLPKYREFITKTVGADTDLFLSQIPGGMLSNLESQLKQQKAGHRLQEVLDEVPRVRKDAGYPPLVTPSSQIVGTQAVLNVLMGRYKQMSGEFQDLVLGYYGKNIAPPNPEVVAIAEQKSGKKPISVRPADLIHEKFDDLKAEAMKLEGFNGSDEDVLTYACFPQVAPKFFKTRPLGPIDPTVKPAASASATTAAAPTPQASVPGQASVAAPGKTVDFMMTVNGQRHVVQVETLG